MRTLSLFSGYGGLDLAVEAVFGARTAYVADIDKGACKILAHRFPHAENLGDVSEVDYASLGDIDVITGGFPCQDVSTAGKRAGMKDGTRSGLWSEMHRAVSELRPRFVVIENVRGLLSAEADSDVEPCPWCLGDDAGPSMRALGAVLADLADIGYDAQWCGLRAAGVGAPHGRFRVFILASPADREREEQREPAERGLRPEPRRGAAPAADADRLGHERPGGARRRGQGSEDGDSGPVVLLGTPRTSSANGASRHRMAPGQDRGQLEQQIANLALLPTQRATDGTNGGPNQRGSSGDLMLPSAVHSERWGVYAAAIARWEALTRPAPDPTEPTGKNGAHRLSARFTEWMMGLPDGWIADAPDITRNEALKACGNGVVPQQAIAALEWLLAMEETA